MKLVPPDGFRIILTLFLSFLLGLQREERRADQDRYIFGGVRTFPLIGLIGYAMTFLSGPNLIPMGIGFAVIGAFLWLSYQHKLQSTGVAGVTTEVSGLTTYVIGALVARDQYWIATTLTVIGLLLLELKEALESISKRIPTDEIFTFTKFLLLTLVILPVLPNQNFGPFQFNPFKTWLVVVAVSGVSYASYILQARTKAEGGILLAAILGGLYSSTATTVVLAKEAKQQSRPHLFSGSVLVSSSVMYLRLLVLLGIFNRELMRLLLPSFLLLTGMGVLVGAFWSRRRDPGGEAVKTDAMAKNPLELQAALLFGLFFVVMLVLTHYAVEFLGRGGVFALAGLSGLTDITPFIMGLTQSAGATTPIALAAAGIVIAAAVNNLVKGGYAYGFGDRETGRESLGLLVVYGLLGFLPLLHWPF
ncbi:MAG: MgtC/SapB family protein [Candidatus Acidiferrales bacterium]